MGNMTPHEIEIAAVTNGLKMKDVCERAGVAFSTFWRWKNKGAKISLESHDKLCAAVRGDETGVSQ
jgi:transcriptional regulator with XRE-family HTH domain